MPALAAAIVLAWLIFGSPLDTVSGWVWPEDRAPWETMDAFYYPDRSDLTTYRSRHGVGEIDDCRARVEAEARSLDDPDISRGDYECGVGEVDRLGGLIVYRITTR